MFALRNIVNKVGARNASTWQIFGAALLERPASIVREFNALEKAYQAVQQQIEVENSLLSDFELQGKAEEEAEKNPNKKKQRISIILTKDLIREWKAEKAAVVENLKYKQVTDPKDPKRLLDRPLVFLVKSKLGKDEHWIAPQTLHQEGESIRETAERSLTEFVGDKVEYVTLGNAPIAFFKYKYPQNVRDETNFIGAKIFFHRMQITGGEVAANTKLVTDFMWADSDEAMRVLDESLGAALKPTFYQSPRVEFTSIIDSILGPEAVRALKSSVNQ